MRLIVIIVAVLMSLGLAAFGVVSAQKASQNAGAAPVATQAAPVQTAGAPPPAPAKPASPVTQLAQNTAAPSAPGQNPAAAKPAPGSVAAPPPSPAGAAATNNIPACDKPGGMGLSRIVEIDTTGGPAFGFQHFKQYDFLRDKEVVLTFDDGPWPENTPAVVKALTDECLKATFFEIGKHASWHPEITKQVIEAGMTVGSHTWGHKDLARNPYAKDMDQAEQEIEMGVSAVHMAANAPIAPFFRFPDLQHTSQLMTYLGERNIAAFSTDIDSRDFKFHQPEQVIKSVMSQLEKRGKGIILMHDFKRATAEALPELLRQLKAGGYKVVHMVPKQPVTTVPKYDEMVAHEDKLSSNNTRPESSVVRTIGQ
jgi:peptidoglycan/xylan/chitin deacetylase (PgdA/CDA1 family)